VNGTSPIDTPETWKRLLFVSLLFVAALPIYLAGVGRNPPGFFVDESSIGYNAWTIETRGVSEFDKPYPLFFRSGADYKNPPFIYLLALLFKIFGPSVTLARTLSAILGDLGATALAWLGWSIGGRRWIAVATFATAVATPAFFEIAHLAFEVAAFPLALALLLIAVWNARDRWSGADVVRVALALAFVTYAYTSGRLFGPAFAAGLLFFAKRNRLPAIAATYALYGLLIVPMAVFHFRNDHAMTARYRGVGYANEPGPAFAERFAVNYFRSVDPVGQSLLGDWNERHHVPGSGGNVLVMTFVLGAAGVIAALRRRTPWDKFMLFALVVAPIPVALTFDPLHSLRTVSYPLLLMVFSIDSLRSARKPLLLAAFILGIAQAGWFFTRFIEDSGKRGAVFDCCVPAVLDAALAQNQRPIYLRDQNAYVNVLWFAALRGVDRKTFIIDETPPPGAIVVTNGMACPGCRLLARDQLFSAYVKR